MMRACGGYGFCFCFALYLQFCFQDFSQLGGKARATKLNFYSFSYLSKTKVSLQQFVCKSLVPFIHALIYNLTCRLCIPTMCRKQSKSRYVYFDAHNTSQLQVWVKSRKTKKNNSLTCYKHTCFYVPHKFIAHVCVVSETFPMHFSIFYFTHAFFQIKMKMNKNNQGPYAD